MSKAETFFRGIGPNFMTPEPIMWVESPQGLLVELSYGSGIFGGELYGVTVVDADGNDVGLSEPFETREAAETYMVYALGITN